MKKISLAISVLLSNGLAVAQSVDIDWSKNQLLDSPSIVDKTIKVRVTVKNVNDLLYSYTLEKTATRQAGSDAGNLFPPPAPAAPPPPGCPTSQKALDDAVAAFEDSLSKVFKLTPGGDGKYKSVPLSTTLNGFDTTVKPAFVTLTKKAGIFDPSNNTSGCGGSDLTAANAKFAAEKVRFDSWQQKAAGPHVAVFEDVTLSAGLDYTLVITEYYRDDAGVDNKTVEHSYSFSPSSNILTLSLGALMSSIEQRTYTSAKDPANTQQNILNVGGRGRFIPMGVALLNYEIPRARWLDDSVGLGLSSGLVIDFGASAAKASPLGFFAGPSVDLWHRLFLSVGAHFGQFADYPPGLANGSIIPASFGDLTPSKRWTTRLAFGITYQVSGFGKTAAKGKADGTTAAGTAKK